MEEKILELLNQEKKAYSVYEINDYLNFKTADELKELLKVLNQLEDSLKIYRTNKDKYMLFTNNNIKIGTMIVNKKGYGFVDVEGKDDIYVSAQNMNDAIHGDKVIVEITTKNKIGEEGRILRIIERKIKKLVGTIYYKKNQAHLNLDEDKIKLDIIIDKKHTMNAVEGHKVIVKMGAKLKGNTYKGEVISIIGHINDPGVDILSIAAKYEINTIFSETVLNEVDNLPTEVRDFELKNRKDLRDKVIFTIDGDDTKDIDDALSIEKLPNDNYKLGVHIADVTYYVKEGNKVDDEAKDRGTSVYLADRVIPMLPHKLSNGICSLNPGVDRLAISCEMEIDDHGKVIDYDIFESVINSKIQMTYKNVNKILEEDFIPKGYEDYAKKLKQMHELAKILRKNKVNRGYIDFEIDEAKIIVNEQGEAIDVKLRERGAGENLIEDFMIAANETVSSHIYFMQIPFIYRVHGTPSEEKLESFLTFLSILGYKVNGKVKNDSPKSVQQLLDSLKDKEEYPIISKLLLRSMRKAIYDINNIGHFGLGSKCYTHFTSPIRRYPDTTVHRLLRTYLFNNDLNEATIKKYEQVLPVIAEHSSYKERQSVECEREVDDMKKAEYMEKHIGEEYEGIINTITNFGMFVELKNLIEGLVRIDSFKNEYYVYNERTFSLVSENNKRGYRLGDKVKVRVIAASKETRNIDFEIVK